MSASCFDQILRGFRPVSALTLHTNDDEYDLVGYDENIVITSKLSNGFRDGPSPETERCTYQEYTIDAKVVAVLKWDGQFGVLDETGAFNQFCENVLNDDTADFFEDSPTMDEGLGRVRQVRCFDVPNALAASVVFSGTVAIVSYENYNLVVSLHSLGISDPVRRLVVKTNVLRRPSNVHLKYLRAEDVDRDFISSWFPQFEQLDPSKGYLLVFNCESSACCIELGHQTLNSGFFFDWPSACVSASFYPTATEDGLSTRSVMLLSFEDGALVKLCSTGGEILRFCLSSMKCARRVGDFFVCSDYKDCQSTSLKPTGDSFVVSIKGVVSFCSLGDEATEVIALTSHGGLYLLRPTEVRSIPGQFAVPSVTSFQATLTSLAYLDELNAKILAHDRAIQCIAASVNEHNFRFRLAAQVVQIVARHHVFRIVGELLDVDSSSPPVFVANDWHVVATFCSHPNNELVHVQQLASDFSKKSPMELIVRTVLDEDTTGNYLFEVRLVSLVGEGKFRPTLRIGQARLDVLSFAEPETSQRLSATWVPQLADLLAAQSRQMSSRLLQTLSVEIPLENPVGPAIVEKLLNTSRALWRAQQMADACAKKSFNVVVRDRKLGVKVRDDAISISGEDWESVVLMKHAALSAISAPRFRGLTLTMLVQVEKILADLEVVKSAGEGPLLVALNELYTRKAQKINDVLNGTSSGLD